MRLAIHMIVMAIMGAIQERIYAREAQRATCNINYGDQGTTKRRTDRHLATSGRRRDAEQRHGANRDRHPKNSNRRRGTKQKHGTISNAGRNGQH